jgi:hypothetical protein
MDRLNVLGPLTIKATCKGSLLERDEQVGCSGTEQLRLQDKRLPGLQVSVSVCLLA